jgi:hypothetical protein
MGFDQDRRVVEPIFDVQPFIPVRFLGIDK